MLRLKPNCNISRTVTGFKFMNNQTLSQSYKVQISKINRMNKVRKPCDLNKTDCGVITKVEAIGHGTHADSTNLKDSESLSNTDFNVSLVPNMQKFTLHTNEYLCQIMNKHIW